MVVLGLCCCTWTLSSCSQWSAFFTALRGVLLVMTSHIINHESQKSQASVVVAYGLNSCGSQALEWGP